MPSIGNFSNNNSRNSNNGSNNDSNNEEEFTFNENNTEELQRHCNICERGKSRGTIKGGRRKTHKKMRKHRKTRKKLNPHPPHYFQHNPS
jgi:hypothetical protein